MLFPKIVNQMASFGQIRKNSVWFRNCRPILDIFGFTIGQKRIHTHRPKLCLQKHVITLFPVPRARKKEELSINIQALKVTKILPGIRVYGGPII